MQNLFLPKYLMEKFAAPAVFEAQRLDRSILTGLK
jgi:hypothetical protein